MNVAATCGPHITAKTAKCRQNALDGHISAIRCHVPPKWGEREPSDIRREEVREWVDSIPTPGAATRALKMLQQISRWAIKTYELEIFDPTRGVELPARPIYRREAMTAEEIAYMLREAAGEPWEANIILAVALGPRPSEALGVDRPDIDWRSGWVHIQRGCRTLQSGGTAEHPCKTRLSDRCLKLPRWALARLRQIRGRRRRGRVRGDPTPRQVHTQYKRFLKSIGPGRCPIEGLRHSRAALAIASGAAIADASVAMGRTATRMVIEHHTMGTGAVSKRAADAAGRAIEEGLEAHAMAAQLSLDLEVDRVDVVRAGGELSLLDKARAVYGDMVSGAMRIAVGTISNYGTFPSVAMTYEKGRKHAAILIFTFDGEARLCNLYDGTWHEKEL